MIALTYDEAGKHDHQGLSTAFVRRRAPKRCDCRSRDDTATRAAPWGRPPSRLTAVARAGGVVPAAGRAAIAVTPTQGGAD